MNADRRLVEIAMAKECMTLKDIAKKAQMPEPTVKNVLSGRGVKPATLGRVARALNVAPEDLILDGLFFRKGDPMQ